MLPPPPALLVRFGAADGAVDVVVVVVVVVVADPVGCILGGLLPILVLPLVCRSIFVLTISGPTSESRSDSSSLCKSEADRRVPELP